MVEARTLFEVDAAFQKVGAESHRAVLMMLPTTTRDAQQSELADLATRNRLPVLYNKSQFCKAGSLIRFGARYLDFFRRAAA